MSIFMTAKKQPFYAGTYFPPVSRYGVAGFREVLLAIAKMWEKEKESVCERAEHIVDEIARMDEGKDVSHGDVAWDKDSGDGVGGTVDYTLPGKAARMISGNFDGAYGGFGEAPKFPMPHNLLFLMMYACLGGEKDIPDCEVILEQVKMTLMQMRRGGIFDQIGYGFSRYSTDRIYLVPHFEKMLYDNALLIIRGRYFSGYGEEDGGLCAAGDDRGRRRLLLRAGRRQRRWGRKILCLEHGGGLSGSG